MRAWMSGLEILGARVWPSAYLRFCGAADFGFLEPRFEFLDPRFEFLDPRFELLDPRFELLELRFPFLGLGWDGIGWAVCSNSPNSSCAPTLLLARD